MKFLTTVVCVLALAWAGTNSSFAQDQEQHSHSLGTKIADAAIVRPISFGSTVIGSVFFVIGLPVTSLMKKNKPAADALVIHPAWATFKRPLGEMDTMAF